MFMTENSKASILLRRLCVILFCNICAGFLASGKIREKNFSAKSGNFVECQGKSANFPLVEVN